MKKNKLTNRKDKVLVIYIAFAIFFLFGLNIMQFYKLQILQKNKWDKLASVQHHYVATEYFRRGCFYSNVSIKKDHPSLKQPFVIEVPKFHLYIDPESIPIKYKNQIAKKLFEFIKVQDLEKEKIFSSFYKKTRSRKIFSYLDKNIKEDIFSWWKSFSKERKIVGNAVFFIRDYKRSYPFGSMLSQVLHTVQEEKDQITFQSKPTGGLELYFNEYLKGQLGKKIITKSLRHSLDTGKVLEEPKDGCDIYLTINHYLQAITEDELIKGVKNANAKGGWAIMMDPYTGEVLALAQLPEFNVLEYPKYFNDPDLTENTKLKAATDVFELGSIMKPITVAICMKANEELEKNGQAKIFDPDEKIKTSDGFFPGRKKPIKDGRRHNFLNLNMAIQKSSNIYMGRIIDRLINKLGEKWYRDALINIFEFNQKTNIEYPMEELGLIPRFDKCHPNGTKEWSKATPYSLAIGYNLLANSFQMIKIFSAFANGGYLIKPTFLKKIVSTDKNKNETIILDNTINFSLDNKKRILSEKNCKRIIEAMKYTTKLGGTASAGDIYGYTECGKSGTAEKIVNGTYSKNVHISSFIGIAPADNPRFVLMVVIDEPEKKIVESVGKMQQGGVCAAPVFREIAIRSLNYLGVKPDDPYGYPPSDPRRDVTKASWLNEVQELKNLYMSWNESITPTLKGTGLSREAQE